MEGSEMADWHELGNGIADWIRDYADGNGITTLVVGVSGGKLHIKLKAIGISGLSQKGFSFFWIIAKKLSATFR